MKFGLLFRVQDPPNAENIVGRWQEALETAKVAEESGFDGVSSRAPHDARRLPALSVAGARRARRDHGTARARHHGSPPPFEHPIHTAEHGAMVDVLSNGRLRLGVGMANFPEEFELFGLAHKRQVSRFEEGIEIVQRAWAGEHRLRGQALQGQGHITPKPVGAELWIGAMSGPACAGPRASAPAWPTDPLHNLDVMKYWADLYREAGVEHGTSDKLGVVLLRDGWVADSLEEVEEGLVAVHPQRALVLLRARAALGRRARAPSSR